MVLERPDVRLRLAPSLKAGGLGPSSATVDAERQGSGNEQQRPAPCQAAAAGAPCSPDAHGGSAGAAGTIEVEIRRVTIEKGNVTVEDGLTLPGHTTTRAFSDVNVTATQATPGGEIAFDLALRDDAPAGLGALAAKGKFRGLTAALALDNPRLEAEATLSSFHVDSITPYLQGSPLGQRLGGRASLRVHYQGDLSSRHRGEGPLDISQMTYADPSLWPSALPGADATITYAVSLIPEELVVEKLTLKLGTIALRASGRVRDFSERPTLKEAEWSADLPLPELARFIPWKAVGGAAATLRPMLEAGGRIVIDRAVLPEIALAGPSPTVDAVLRTLDLTATISGMSVQPSPSMPWVRNIRGTLRLANDTAVVQGLRAQLASVDLPDISATVTEVFRAPRVRATIKGPLALTQSRDAGMVSFLSRLGLEEASGAADVDLAVTVDTERPENFQLQGRVGLRDVKARTTLSPARLEGLSADVAITPAVAQISNLVATVVAPAVTSAPEGRFTVQLQGRVDGWRERPAIMLQRLNTSAMSLPVLVGLLPWGTLSDAAGPIKDVLQAGGTATIEELAFAPINLSAPPANAAHLVSLVKAVVSVRGLALKPTPNLPRMDGIAGRLSLNGGVLTATDVRGRVGPLSLPSVSVRMTNLGERPKVAVRATGPLQVVATSDTEVETMLWQHGLKSLTGQAVIDMHAEYDQRTPNDWEVQGTLVLAGIRAEAYPESAVVDGLGGRVTVSRLAGMDIVAEDIIAQVNQAPVRLSGKFLGLGTSGPVVNATVYTNRLNLAHVREFVPALKRVGLAGTLDADLEVYLPYAAAERSRLNGSLATHGLALRLPGSNVSVETGESAFTLSGNTVSFQRLHCV